MRYRDASERVLRRCFGGLKYETNSRDFEIDILLLGRYAVFPENVTTRSRLVTATKTEHRRSKGVFSKAKRLF